MLLRAEGDPPPLHQAYLGDPARLTELGRGIEALRSRRDPSLVDAFFARYAPLHREREQALPLDLSMEDWQGGWLEVRDLLRGTMVKLSVPRHQGRARVRKLGWLELGQELARARALQRAHAPEPVLDNQRERVRMAFLGAGWVDRNAPASPLYTSEREFWLEPVRVERNERGEVEVAIGERSPRDSAQEAWSRAQSLVERGIELCLEPLADPVGLGATGFLHTEGLPLFDTRSTAHAGWVEPTWIPSFLVGSGAQGIESHVRPRPGPREQDLRETRRRLAQAAEQAAADGSALVWWDEPF